MVEMQFPTIEVFTDADGATFENAALLEGLDIVAAPAGPLDVLMARRGIRLHYGQLDSVDMRRVRWPQFRADLNLVITDRVFQPESGDDTYDTVPLGRADLFNDGPQVAIVSTKSKFLRNVVAHELGHMLGVRQSAVTRGEDGHCEKPACIMYPTLEEWTPNTLRKNTFRQRMVSRLGSFAASSANVSAPIADSFCDDCSGDMRSVAQRIFNTKNGIPTPKRIY